MTTLLVNWPNWVSGSFIAFILAKMYINPSYQGLYNYKEIFLDICGNLRKLL